MRSGTTPEALVPREFPGATVLPLDSDAEVLSAVLDGTAHAAAVDQVMATRWLHEYPDALRRAFEDLFDRLPQAIAMRKGGRRRPELPRQLGHPPSGERLVLGALALLVRDAGLAGHRG